MPDNRTFYTYLLIDSLDGEVFYVGKGQGKRMYQHRKDAISGNHVNPHLQRKIRKLLREGGQVIYKKVFSTQNESEAFEKETEYINHYGIDNLCNLTFGGEGSSGYKHTAETKAKLKRLAMNRDMDGANNPNFGGGHWSEESKRKFSQLQSRIQRGKNNGFYGKTHSLTARKKISAVHKGKTISDQHKKAIAEKLTGRKRPKHSKKMSGAKNPKVKLTWEDVRQIRAEYATGNSSYSKLATKYGLDKSSIGDIIKHESWKEE